MTSLPLTNPEKIAVVDDDASVRRALTRLLTSAGFEVKSYPSAAAFIEKDAGGDIGCILLDIHMPDMSGTELQELLTNSGSDTPIIFLTAFGDIPTSVKAMKSGAVDFLTKPVDASEMFNAIGDGLERHRRLTVERRSLENISARLDKLTDREFEVMRYVVSGALNKQIAADLGISEKTVKVHRGHVLHKMEVRSVAELVRICDRAGIEPEIIR